MGQKDQETQDKIWNIREKEAVKVYIRPFTLFSTLHPVLLLIYAVGAPVLAMFGKNPVVLLIIFSCALIVHAFYLGGKATWEGMKGITFIIIFIMVFNMFTNAMGVTELFKIGSKLFTLESMGYGFANGLMLGTVVLWFRCFTALVPNDKFLYLFGRRFPTSALLLSMILKLFPDTKYKIRCIQFAQSTAGMKEKEPLKLKLQRSMRQMSGLMEWSMEDGIETADSMKARGYGAGRRGCYEKFHFNRYDAGMLIYMIATYTGSVLAVVMQNQRFQYYPVMSWEKGQGAVLAGNVVFLIMFLLTPVWMEIFRKGGKKK